MRRIPSFLLLTAMLSASACSTTETDGPTGLLNESDVIEVLPDYADPTTAMLDRSGVGGSQFPDSIALTTEQKAAIQQLKSAFEAANAADIASLRAIEAEAKAAREGGKSREEIRAILARALPIRARLDAAFQALRAAIFAVYTPAQQAWLAANRPPTCGPDGGPRLTEEQLASLKALRGAFEDANRADIQLLRNVGEQVKAAKQAGKSDAEIKAILATANAARERLRAAERKLHEDIMAILTPAQRAAWCVGRGVRGPGGVVRNG